MRRFFTATVLIGVLGLGAGIASADTVVKTNGDSYTGVVTKTDDGYSVKTKAGTIVIPADDVEKVIKEAPAPPAAPRITAPSPVTPTPHVSTPDADSPPAPAVVPTRAAPRVVDAKTLQALLDQGQAALTAGEYKAAVDSFKDVVSLDRNNAIALHGMGAAYMYLNDFNHAKEPMEKAIKANPSRDRALVLNMAVLQIAVNNPMRGAKIIKDYLTVHSTVPDEPMLNAMAIALNDADGQARKGSLYIDCSLFYQMANAKVEAAVPGQKRWGIEWMPAATVDAKIDAMTNKQKEADKDASDLDSANADLDTAQKDLDKQQELVQRGFSSAYEVSTARQTLQQAITERDRLSAAYDAAIAAIPHPNFPTALSLVALDDLTPPPVRGVTLAMGGGSSNTFDGTSTDYQTPKPKPKPRSKPKPQNNRSTGDSGFGSTSGGETQLPDPPAIEVVQSKPTVAQKVRITSYAVAFPIAPDLVVTAAAPLQDASDIQLETADGSALKGEVVRTDDATGLALLRVTGHPLRPLTLAATFAGGSLQCAGFPTANIFAPSGEVFRGYGQTAQDGWKVKLEEHPRLPGGPLLDSASKIVGVELAARDSEPTSIPAATLEQLRKFLGDDAKPAGVFPPPVNSLLQVVATRENR